MFSSLWPSPVTLALGDELVRVHQLRLRDLAALETWARAFCSWEATPSELLRQATAVPDATPRRAALRRAYESAEAATLEWGSPAIQAVIDSQAGRAQILSLATRGQFQGEAALSLVMAATPDQWHELSLAAWAADVLDLASDQIDAEIGVEWPRQEANEGEVQEGLWEVVEATGWSLEVIGDLTLSQWDWVRSAGQGSGGRANPLEPPNGMGWKAFEERIQAPRRRFWAETDQ